MHQMHASFRTVAIILAVLYILFKCASFIRNYTIARRSGFPVYISPVLSKSAVWLILGPTFQLQFEKYLPEWIYYRLDFIIRGWEIRWREKMHRRPGKAFVVVTPDECSLW
jgi:hypothetical protein